MFVLFLQAPICPPPVTDLLHPASGGPQPDRAGTVLSQHTKERDIIMDFKEIGESIGLEEDEYAEMLEVFIDAGGTDLEKLEAALKKGDAQQAHEASHSMKGAAGSLCLEKIFELTKTIDDKARRGSLEDLGEQLTELRKEYNLLIDILAQYSAR